MAFDPQKKEALQAERQRTKEEERRRILAERETKNKERARATLKKYGTGKNFGVARNETDRFRNNLKASEAARKQAEKFKGLQKNMPLKNIGRNRRKNTEIMAKASASVFAIFQANLLSDWPYGVALFFAILKDMLDLLEATGVGYIAVIIFTFMCSIFIAMMMILGGSPGGRRQRKIVRSWLVLLAGTTTELIFGIDILPIETLTVIVIYFLFLIEKQQAEEEMKKQLAG